MTLSFTRRVNRTLGVPDSGDVIMAEHVNELQAALEDVSDGTTPIPLAGIEAALGQYGPLVNSLSGIYDVRDAGAVPGSVSAGQRTINTQRIQEAADAAYADDGILVIKGVYEFDGLLAIRSHVRAESGTLVGYGDAATTLAVRVGSDQASDETFSRLMNLPSLVCSAKSGTGWSGLGVGYEFANLYSCHVLVPHIQGFAKNALLTAYSTGNVYNQYHFDWLDNGQINLDMAAGDAGGWVNENEVHIGRASHETSEGTNVAGVRHIRLIKVGDHALDNNLFIKPSIEGNVPEYHVEFNGVNRNTIIQGRWEAQSPKVLYHDAYYNVIMHGYRPASYPIVRTSTGTSAYNEVWDIDRRRIFAGGTTGGTILENVTHSANAALTIMEAGGDTLGTDPSTGYAAQLSARTSRYKQATDDNPRIQIDHANGRIYFGNGSASIANYLANFGSVGIQSNTYFRTGSVASLPSASESYRGMWIRVEGGSGVKDGLYVCRKTSSDTYEWVELA